MEWGGWGEWMVAGVGGWCGGGIAGRCAHEPTRTQRRSIRSRVKKGFLDISLDYVMLYADQEPTIEKMHMANLAAANTSESTRALSNEERIAILEERSLHASTKADLHRTALYIVIGVIGLLGSLIIHLHNTTLVELSGIREVLNELLLRASGG